MRDSWWLASVAAVTIAVAAGAGIRYQQVQYSQTCLGQLAALHERNDASTDLPRPSEKILPNTAYTLVPESFDWTSLCAAFGNPVGHFDTTREGPGGSEFATLPKQGGDPDPVTIAHYAITGAVVASRGWSNTVGNLTVNDAYRFAVTWLRNHGGLPGDAIVQGNVSNGLMPQGKPGVRVPAYGFTWTQNRSSGLLFGKRIFVNVDERDGHPDVEMYVRIWPGIGSPLRTVPRMFARPVRPFKRPAVASGICSLRHLMTGEIWRGPDNVAAPCREYNAAPGSNFRHIYILVQRNGYVGFD